MEVEQILAELVAVDSTSSRSNAEIVDVVARRVEELGMRVRVLPYEDERGVGKVQLVAFAPREAEEVELALVGHTETV